MAYVADIIKRLDEQIWFGGLEAYLHDKQVATKVDKTKEYPA